MTRRRWGGESRAIRCTESSATRIPLSVSITRRQCRIASHHFDDHRYLTSTRMTGVPIAPTALFAPGVSSWRRTDLHCRDRKTHVEQQLKRRGLSRGRCPSIYQNRCGNTSLASGRGGHLFCRRGTISHRTWPHAASPAATSWRGLRRRRCQHGVHALSHAKCAFLSTVSALEKTLWDG